MSDAVAALGREDRKRLGQYFTGEPLARVLAALADVQAYNRQAIPFCGIWSGGANAARTACATASASLGGTAFPIWR